MVSKSPEMKRPSFSVRRITLILIACLMSVSIMAQKINVDTLSTDQLKMYRDAVTMRSLGMVLSFTGPVGIIVGLFNVAGFINYNHKAGTVFLVSFCYGIPATLIGTALWVVGASTMKLINLDFEELNLHFEKAVRLRKAGMAMTLGGVGLVAIATIIDPAIHVVPAVCGLVSTFAGIPLWAGGAGIKARTQLLLKNFKTVPDNSLAIGLGMRITF